MKDPRETTEPRETLGRAELEVLQFINATHPISVGEVAQHFFQTRGLARTTVQTMMQRLVGKGFLKRKRSGAVYVYSPSISASRVVTTMVAEFVKGVLGGSVSPFLAYLSQNNDLSDAEIAELRALVRRLDPPDNSPSGHLGSGSGDSEDA